MKVQRFPGDTHKERERSYTLQPDADTNAQQNISNISDCETQSLTSVSSVRCASTTSLH